MSSIFKNSTQQILVHLRTNSAIHKYYHLRGYQSMFYSLSIQAFLPPFYDFHFSIIYFSNYNNTVSNIPTTMITYK